PRPECRFIAQRVKLFEGVQEDVLNEIVDFRARYASEQNAVYEWCKKIVKPRESLAVTCQNRSDQHHFDRRLLRLLGGVWACQQHVGGGVHRRLDRVNRSSRTRLR